MRRQRESRNATSWASLCFLTPTASEARHGKHGESPLSCLSSAPSGWNMHSSLLGKNLLADPVPPGQGELKAICNNWGAQILPKTLTLSQRCDVGTPPPSVKQTKKLYLSCTHSSRFLGTSNFPPSLENQWGTGKEALMERHKQVKIWWVWFYIFFLGIPYINLK